MAAWGVGLLFICFCANANHINHNGHKVLRVVPTTDAQVQGLIDLVNHPGNLKLDFWREPADRLVPCDIEVRPQQFHLLKRELQGLGLTFNVLIHDVQKAIDYQMAENIDARGPSTFGYDNSKYHPLEDIDSWLLNVSTVSSMATLFSPAVSYEKRTMHGIKISSSSSKADKPAIYLEGGIHAREWISPATVIYMAGKLLSEYGTNPNITHLVDTFDWYVVPVTNPDGYVYTWNGDRMWRKTRSRHQNCIGVDPNRNWDWHWCEAGASRDPCSDTYCGPSAFSESEVHGVADFITARKANIKAFIDFHSYSQLWMTPWGWTKANPVDALVQNKSSEAAVDALKVKFGTKFEYGSIANIIYIASGSSADWTYGAAGIKFSVGVELRDTGKYGFLLPPDQIIPSGEETLDSLIAFANFVENNM